MALGIDLIWEKLVANVLEVVLDANPNIAHLRVTVPVSKLTVVIHFTYFMCIFKITNAK